MSFFSTGTRQGRVRKNTQRVKTRSLRFETLEEKQLLTIGLTSSVEAPVAEGTAHIEAFRISSSELERSEPIEIWFAAGGTAAVDLDYELYAYDAAGNLSSLQLEETVNSETGDLEYGFQVVLPPDASYVSLYLSVVADSVIESAETIALSFIPTDAVSVDVNADSATVSIRDTSLFSDVVDDVIVVSGLAVSAGTPGGWKADGGVLLTGTVSGSNGRQAELQIDGASLFAAVDAEGRFTFELPASFDYDVPATLRVRGLRYDASSANFSVGNWTSLVVTPTLPAVASLAAGVDSETGNLQITGTLANVVGKDYAEVEFRIGSDADDSVVLGYALTDENGAFSFVPEGLTVGNNVVVVRAVYHDESGNESYGAYASVNVAYEADCVDYSLETSLLYPLNTDVPTTTSTPALQTTSVFNSEYDIRFEYRWKLSTSDVWSDAFGVIPDAEDVAEDSENTTVSDSDVSYTSWTGFFIIADLYASLSTVSVNVQTRAALYDYVVGDYVANGEWTNFDFDFVPTTFTPADVTALTLANFVDSASDGAADVPVLAGTISTASRGVTVNFYTNVEGLNVWVGSTTTDANGDFSWTTSGLAYGTHVVTAVATQWNPISREYVDGLSRNLTFEYQAPTITAPTISRLSLLDDTGNDADGITANVTIYGRLDAGADAAYLPVLYDVDNDGVADGWTRADDNGDFCFTPTLSYGTSTISVCSARWNPATQTSVVGAWQCLTFSYVAPVGTAPVVRNLTLVSESENDAVLPVVCLPKVSGRVSSETGFDNLQLQFELTTSDSDAVIANYETSVSPTGEFCWTPDVSAPETDTTAVIRVRAGLLETSADPVTGETIFTVNWGEWSTTPFVWAAPRDSEIVSSAATRSEDGVVTVSGVLKIGDGVISTRVEFDLDADGIPDGVVLPNSDAEFSLMTSTTFNFVRLRVVDSLPDGSTRRAAAGWQTTPVFDETSGAGNSVSEPSLELSLAEGVTLRISGTDVASRLAVDYDLDGVRDALVTIPADGVVSGQDIQTALSGARISVADGFSLVNVWLTTSTSEENAATPVSCSSFFPLLTSDESGAVADYNSFCANIAALLTVGLTTSVYDYDVQTTEESADSSDSDASDSFAASIPSLVGQLSGVGALDLDFLRYIPLPTIAAPVVDGETPDFQNDVALQGALAQIDSDYAAEVLNVQRAYEGACDAAYREYLQSVLRAQNAYLQTVASCDAKTTKLNVKTWSETAEALELAQRLLDELTALDSERASRQSGIDAAFNQWFTDRNLSQEGFVSVLTQRPELKNDYLTLCTTTSENELELDAYVQRKTQEITLKYARLQAIAERAFDAAQTAQYTLLATEKSAAQRRLTLAAADAEKAYANCVARAAKDASAAFAGAYSTAVSSCWTALQNAASVWRAATQTTWSDLVAAELELNAGDAIAAAAEYAAQATADADARYDADVAEAAAMEAYQRALADKVWLEEFQEGVQLLKYQNRVSSARMTYALNSTKLVSQKLTAQIDEIESVRLQEVRDYRVTALASSPNWSSFESARLDAEATLYRTLTDSAAEIENGRLDYLERYYKSYYAAQGLFSKALFDLEAALDLQLAALEYDYQTSVVASEKEYALAPYAADEAEAETPTTYDSLLTIVQTAYDSWFDVLTTACSGIAASLGTFYTSVVSAFKTDFDAQIAAEITFQNSVGERLDAFYASVESLEARYDKSAIDAYDDYYAALLSQSLTQTRAGIAAELTYNKALVDAKTAFCLSVVQAACDKDRAVVEANADAAQKLIGYSVVVGSNRLQNCWNFSDPKYFTPYNTSVLGEIQTTPALATTVSALLETLRSASNPLLSHIPYFSITAPNSDSATDDWTPWATAVSSVLAATTLEATLNYEAERAEAWQAYVGKLTGIRSDAEVDGVQVQGVAEELTSAKIEAERTALVSALAAETRFNDAILAAQNVANGRYNSAIRAVNLTGFLTNYTVASTRADATFNTSVASAFGTYQTALRREVLRDVSRSDSLYGYFSSEANWATQTNRLRRQYSSATASAVNGYAASARTAGNALRSSLLNAEIVASNATFNALKSFSQSVERLGSDYELANYDAGAAWLTSALRAECKALYANAAAETTLARERAAIYTLAISEIASEFETAELAGLTVSSYAALASTIQTIVRDLHDDDVAFCVSAYGCVPEESTDDDDEEEEEPDASTRLGALRAANRADFDDAINAVNDVYRESTRQARQNRYLDLVDAYATEAGALRSALLTRKSALKDGYNGYFSAIDAAFADFADAAALNNRVLGYQQERVDLLNETLPTSGIFSNPIFDYDVCFAAGTTVLTADGSRRPIETLRPGDLVLAADHLDPEANPAPAKVVRFFDNGEKSVVRLCIGGEEIVCTPEHPFYVVGKGWIRAEALVEGDYCLSADGKRVPFVSREDIAGKQNVYNIEVGDAHTYFVGLSSYMLVHNACKECGAAWYNVKHMIVGCPVVNQRNAEKMQSRGLTGLSKVEETVTHEGAEWAENAATELAATLPVSDTILNAGIVTDSDETTNRRLLAASLLTLSAIVPLLPDQTDDAVKLISNLDNQGERFTVNRGLKVEGHFLKSPQNVKVLYSYMKKGGEIITDKAFFSKTGRVYMTEYGPGEWLTASGFKASAVRFLRTGHCGQLRDDVYFTTTNVEYFKRIPVHATNFWKYWGKQYETKIGFNAFTMSFNAQDNSYVLTEAFKVASLYRTTKSYTMVVVEYTGDFLPLPIAGLYGYMIYCNSKVEIVK